VIRRGSEVGVPQRVRLERATPDHHSVLSNLLELYTHDLSDIFSIDVGADGRFGYPRLASYWVEPATRYPFLIYCGDHLAGFALATRGSPATDDPADLDVAEFFVLRRYRRAGVGRQAAWALWNDLPGQWVVRVLETNRASVPFWSEVVRGYTDGHYIERTRANGAQRWRVFTFTSVCGGPRGQPGRLLDV